jgi:hypothetical protein
MRYLIGLIAIFLVQCASRSGNQLDVSDRRIMWNNCYVCHSPGTYLNGIPQDEMIASFGVDSLRTYLSQNFVNKGPDVIKEHQKVSLTEEEVDAIIRFLMSYEPGRIPMQGQ